MSPYNQRAFAVLALVGIAISLAPSSTRAQSLWLPRDHDTTLLLEALKPGLELIDEEFPTGVVFLGVRHATSSGLALVAELPYAKFKGTFDLFVGPSGEVSESELGNPYLGIEFAGDESPFFGELGVRIPVADEDKFGATIVGLRTDLPARSFAFFPNYVPIQAAINLRQKSESGIVTRLRFGPTVIIPTEDSFSSDTELFGVYAREIGYEGRCVRIGSALIGSILFTDDNGSNLGARSETQFELHGDFGSWKIRPGLELKLPLGEAANFVPLVLGVNIGAAL
jgi:hypothetical protein